MIKLWNETSNDWKAIRKARRDKKSAQQQTWTIRFLELAGCLIIGAWLGYMYGKAF